MQNIMSFEDDYQRIYHQWDEYAKTGNINGLLSLYADNAIFESPLVPILLGQESGVLIGLDEIKRFLIEGTNRRPNQLVRWYRNGKYLVKDSTFFWEYPRQTLNGNQVDIAEIMDIDNSKIVHHRIYWGWFGVNMLLKSQQNSFNKK